MFLLINKPKSISSHGVVNKIRGITGERRVGHAGTLDPNATGLLIIGVGRESTKRLDFFLKKDKQYLAEIHLGEERDTDDIEGKVVDVRENIDTPSLKEIEKIITGMVGQQEQIPPIFSSIKINGKEAYKLARKGKIAEMKPRTIVVYDAKIISYKFPLLEIKFSVSSGTYIRSLARDIGRKLKVGAYLSNLQRTKIGRYDIKNAVSLNELTSTNWRKFTFDL